jgi:hypothetical protein
MYKATKLEKSDVLCVVCVQKGVCIQHHTKIICIASIKNSPAKKVGTHFDLSPTQRTVKASEIAHHKPRHSTINIG